MASRQSGGRSNEGKKTRRQRSEGRRSHAHSPLASDVRAPLETLLETLNQLRQQIKEATIESSHEALLPPLPAFQQASHLISDGCTKLAVLFSSPPAPSSADCAAMTSKVEQTATHLLATYYQISPISGKALHREVESCAQCILQGTENLVRAIITAGSSTVHQGLRGTGSVWEYCDSAAKLSRDNKAAVVKVLLAQLQLLRDGCREAEEMEAEGGRGEDWGEVEGGVSGLCEDVRGVQLGGGGEECEGPREWTDREKQLVVPYIQLVKLCGELASEVCHVVVTSGHCEVERQVRELDEAAAAVQELSPLLDELVGELAAPLQWKDCREAGEKLGTALTHLLHTVSPSHFCQSAGDKWSSLQEKYSDSVSSLIEQITAVSTEP